MAGVLAVLEQRDGKLKRVSHEVLTVARTLADATGGSVDAIAIGAPGVAVDGLGKFGADKVMLVGDAGLALYQAEPYAAAVAAAVGAGAGASDYSAVLVSATALGKDLGPRVAAKLGCALVADVTGLRYDQGIVVTRPVYSGKAIYTLRVTAPLAVISIRPNAVSPVECDSKGAVQDVAVADQARGTRATTIAVKQPERATLDVAEASVVVSGGRGLKDPEHFKLIEDLASAVGGAVGASRAVVDAGWRPHSEQVGQTGRTVSPDLYFAIGISGAVQHLAGMRTAKVIVAINKDPDAPIFKAADYGIVGDLFEIVPRLTEEIKKLGEG